MKRIAILSDPEPAQVLALWTHSQKRMMPSRQLVLLDDRTGNWLSLFLTRTPLDNSHNALNGGPREKVRLLTAVKHSFIYVLKLALMWASPQLVISFNGRSLLSAFFTSRSFGRR
jgi:hypothetical protein